MKPINTTMGELIAALTEAAFEVYENEKASYLVTSLALEEILKNICAPLACRGRRAMPIRQALDTDSARTFGAPSSR
jgi:hypothetical protein